MVKRGRRINRTRTVNVPRNAMGCAQFHCTLGPCMCESVVRLNAPINFVPFEPDHNLGIIGKLLKSPAFLNSPSVEEYGRTIQRYADGDIEYKDLQNMFSRIPRLV